MGHSVRLRLPLRHLAQTLERMKAISAFVLALIPLLAVAGPDDFGVRVQRAKLVEASSEGATYQKKLWSSIGNQTAAAMQECFPREAKADTDVFTLVGDVNDQCQLKNIELRPSTPMSRCFAERFTSLPFPKPPESMSERGVPLVIEMKIKP